MKKNEAFAQLTKIIEHSNKANGEAYEVKYNNWEANGKSRTYFSIEKTWGKKCESKKYGYFDNMTDEYVPEKYGNLNNNFNYSGEKF